VINKRVGRDEWIVVGDRGTRTQRRGDQTRCSGSCTACAAVVPPRSSASTPAEATGAGSPRSAGDYAGIDAADGTASRGAQNIHLRDGDVVASDDEVEVVFESEVDGIAQGQIELAVLDERIESRRIGKARGRHDGAAIGIDGVARGPKHLVKRNLRAACRRDSGCRRRCLLGDGGGGRLDGESRIYLQQKHGYNGLDGSCRISE